MGKRKERRLAALSNAGRRLKLDLFAEPSGDLGGSSVHDEVGGDIDPTQRAGLPNSPSSSGQPPPNPLLLLGQYSDDLDEISNKEPNHVSAEKSPDQNDQEGQLSEGKDMDVNEVDDLGVQKAKQQDMERDSTPVNDLKSQEGCDAREGDAAAGAGICKEMELAENISVEGSSNAQVFGDVGSGWRMVMHEESNQYYYWNTDTGETSWEIPDVLAQTSQLAPDQKVSVTENRETALVGTSEFSSTLGVELDGSSAAQVMDGSMSANLIPQVKVEHGNEAQMTGWAVGYNSEPTKDKNWVTDVHQIESQSNLNGVNAHLGDGHLVVSDYVNDAVADDALKRVDLSTSLMKYCECLLERLKSLQGYGSRLQGHEQMSKYIFEVEIRLSDMKALSSYGSSLLPFWVHSERQLKHLEDVINSGIYQLAVSAQMDDDVEATTDSSTKEKQKPQESVGHESEGNGCENSRKCKTSPVSCNVENNSPNVESDGNAGNARHVCSLGSPSGHLEGVAAGNEVNGTAHLKPELQYGEDVDMDVEMEVEDGVPASIITLGDAVGTREFAMVEQLIQPNPTVAYQSLALGDTLVAPPPLEDEWIPPPPPDNEQVPPPPPDNEQIPPPPPDEPPESSSPHLPSYTETGQPLPYAGHYNSTYPDSNFQYYGHMVALPSSNFYGLADASQVAVPHASLYYDTVPNTYIETASVIVSSVEPVSYYNLQDGSVPPVPVVTTIESSQLQVAPGSSSYDSLAFDQIRAVDGLVDTETNTKLDTLAVGGEVDLLSMRVSSTSTTTQASATNNMKEGVSAPSTKDITTTAAVPGPSTAAKVQPKVSRTKKRTTAVASSLRSNKKVSSLVDKWKAAKEELNENEEDEPENAYEILEKKRQREIEEWRAKQITSGEAKDNANFQPLGGDWRERVKRRRVQAAKEAAKTASEAPAVENQHKSNLAEFSRGLPSGWQAYWDEASKQVYYGNAITLETTWTRPTQ